MGRFITEDPIKDGNNWYIYCNNNPLTYIDPTGLRYGDPSVARNESGVAVSVSGENHGFNSLNERSGPWNGYNGAGSQGMGDFALNDFDIAEYNQEIINMLFEQVDIDWKSVLYHYSYNDAYSFTGMRARLVENKDRNVYIAEMIFYEIESFIDTDTNQRYTEEITPSYFEPTTAIMTIDTYIKNEDGLIVTDTMLIENQSSKDMNSFVNGIAAEIPTNNSIVGIVVSVDITKEGEKLNNSTIKVGICIDE